jgi:hypothetical protein
MLPNEYEFHVGGLPLRHNPYLHVLSMNREQGLLWPLEMVLAKARFGQPLLSVKIP